MSRKLAEAWFAAFRSKDITRLASILWLEDLNAGQEYHKVLMRNPFAVEQP